jgi:WD40 repeat protein
MSSGNIAAASTGEGSVLLFDSVTGNLLRRLNLGTWGTINHDLLFSSDNSLLAVLGQDRTGADSILSLIDVQAAINGDRDFLRVSETFENEYISGMAFNRLGNRLLTGGATVREWSLGTGQCCLGTGGGEFQIQSLNNLRGLTIFAYHPRLDEVATLRPGNYLLVLETTDMANRYLSRFSGRSLPANTFLEYSHDGSLIILVGDGSAPKFFNSTTGEAVASLDSLGVTRFNAIALSNTYLYLAADTGIYVVNLSNPDNYQILPYNATQLAVSADGQRLFYVGRDGMVRVLGLPED